MYASRYYCFGRQLLAPDDMMSQFLKGIASMSYLIKYKSVTLNFSLLAHGSCYEF